MNVFIDLGGNKGQGLRSFISKYNMTPEHWIIETFEPNLQCNLYEHIKDLSYVKINNKAVWTFTGEIEFSIMNENTEGSSVECLMSEDACSNPNSDAFRKHNNIIKVDCISLYDILEKYKNEIGKKVIKMDIEGAEFKVLRQAILDNSIKNVNELWIEWHTKYVKGETEDTCNELKNLLIKNEVSLYDWY